jgi:hypothetical protein
MNKILRNAGARMLPVVLLIVGLCYTATHLRAQEPGEPSQPVAIEHLLDDTYGFLSYWREHNGEAVFGWPVTGVLEEHGVPVKYFERARLEYHPQQGEPAVLRGRIGAEYAEALWLTFNPPSVQAARPGIVVFEATGYTLREPFLRFWNEYNGLETFGYPISEPLWEYIGQHMVQVQYFERGRLERHAVGQGMPDQVQISPLGRELATLRGYPILSPDGQSGAAAQQPSSPLAPTPIPIQRTPTPIPPPTPTATPLPTPTPRPTYNGHKHIVVNLSHQWLYAFSGETLVYDAPISSGRDGFNTPTGSFAIYAKVPVQTMSGTIGGESYRVPNVPHAMYITGDVAMHGTYWHNKFGSGVRMSHGCINLSLGAAKWLYGWAPIGTPVRVTS